MKQVERLTLTQLVDFVDKCKDKYMKVSRNYFNFPNDII